MGSAQEVTGALSKLHSGDVVRPRPPQDELLLVYARQLAERMDERPRPCPLPSPRREDREP